MNLVKELIQSAPIGNYLTFGYNENVILTKIDPNVRSHKGLPIKQNTFMTFATVDPKTRKILAQSEGSYWNLDSKSDYVVQNFIEQFTSVTSIVVAVGRDDVEFETEVLATLPEEEDLDIYLKTKEGAQIMQDNLIAIAAQYITPFTGINSPLFRMKVTLNKKGYFELGKEINWIQTMDSDEKLAIITPYEKRIYKESLKDNTTSTVEPDKTGEPKKEKMVAGNAGLSAL